MSSSDLCSDVVVRCAFSIVFRSSLHGSKLPFIIVAALGGFSRQDTVCEPRRLLLLAEGAGSAKCRCVASNVAVQIMLILTAGFAGLVIVNNAPGEPFPPGLEPDLPMDIPVVMIAMEHAEQLGRSSQNDQAAFSIQLNVQYAQKEAIRSLNSAVAANPGSATAQSNLAYRYTSSSQVSPKVLPIVHLLSLSTMQGFEEEALEAYRAAATLKPFDITPLTGSGSVLMAIGRMKEARSVYQAALQVRCTTVWLITEPGSNSCSLATQKQGKSTELLSC